MEPFCCRVWRNAGEQDLRQKRSDSAEQGSQLFNENCSGENFQCISGQKRDNAGKHCGPESCSAAYHEPCCAEHVAYEKSAHHSKCIKQRLRCRTCASVRILPGGAAVCILIGALYTAIFRHIA